MTAKDKIIELEKKFWDTMVSKDADAATEMMADKSIVIGAQGVSQIAKGDFGKMMEGGKWTLDSYKMNDVQVLFPSDDTAVIGYKVKQKGKMDGKPYDMDCADSTTWVRTGKEWLCVLHTETVLDKAA